jgi:hypothetical protein
LAKKIVSLYMIFFSKIAYLYRFKRYIFEYRCPSLDTALYICTWMFLVRGLRGIKPHSFMISFPPTHPPTIQINPVYGYCIHWEWSIMATHIFIYGTFSSFSDNPVYVVNKTFGVRMILAKMQEVLSGVAAG